MHVIIQRWEEGSDLHVDYIVEHMILLLSKLGLNFLVLCFTHNRGCSSWQGMCSLSVVLADLVVGTFMVKLWLFGSDETAVSLCSLLTITSKTYEALPLPLIALYLWDIWLEDTYSSNWRTSYRVVKNIAPIMALWMIAVLNANSALKVNLLEQRTAPDKKVLLCEVQAAPQVNYLALVISSVCICSMLPYYSWIPQWLSDAERMFEARDRQQMGHLVTLINPGAQMTPPEGIGLIKSPPPRPPLWLSLVLGFISLWTPYLVITTGSLVLVFCVPAFIGVNLMWLECANSVLTGVIFWAKSRRRGPYASMRPNLCSWEVYWHLSKWTISDGKLLSPVLTAKEELCV
ncbi:putative G-protein coupled receptor 160 [Stigmatopora argus]